jgi:hypothetical protein
MNDHAETRVMSAISFCVSLLSAMIFLAKGHFAENYWYFSGILSQNAETCISRTFYNILTISVIFIAVYSFLLIIISLLESDFANHVARVIGFVSLLWIVFLSFYGIFHVTSVEAVILLL